MFTFIPLCAHTACNSISNVTCCGGILFFTRKIWISLPSKTTHTYIILFSIHSIQDHLYCNIIIAYSTFSFSAISKLLLYVQAINLHILLFVLEEQRLLTCFGLLSVTRCCEKILRCFGPRNFKSKLIGQGRGRLVQALSLVGSWESLQKIQWTCTYVNIHWYECGLDLNDESSSMSDSWHIWKLLACDSKSGRKILARNEENAWEETITTTNRTTTPFYYRPPS
jgi:hypothetical protein